MRVISHHQDFAIVPSPRAPLADRLIPVMATVLDHTICEVRSR